MSPHATRTPPRPLPRAAILLALAALVAALAPVLGAPPAAAQGRVTVVNDRGTGQADLRYRTEMTVTGSGFQSVRGGFGGVYVMFGWVDDPAGGSWRPSRGGVTGTDYRYIPDAEEASANQGYLRFVAFPGGSTAAEANAVLSADGGFRVDLGVPGPVFESVDRDGDVREVDCREVTCGVITIGAHGVSSAPNETFTPVPFGTVYDQAPASADAPGAGAGGTGAPSTSGTQQAGGDAGGGDEATGGTAGGGAEGADATVRPGRTRVEADQSTAVVGRALTFTGGGFEPGEQVVAVLDDGLAALGPLRAGESGEVAGVLPLPAETSVGTHVLRLEGAASGSRAVDRFPVTAPTAVPVAEVGEEPVGLLFGLLSGQGTSAGGALAGPVSFAGSALVLVVAVVLAALRRRRASREPAPGPVVA